MTNSTSTEELSKEEQQEIDQKAVQREKRIRYTLAVLNEEIILKERSLEEMQAESTYYDENSECEITQQCMTFFNDSKITENLLGKTDANSSEVSKAHSDLENEQNELFKKAPKNVQDFLGGDSIFSCIDKLNVNSKVDFANSPINPFGSGEDVFRLESEIKKLKEHRDKIEDYLLAGDKKSADLYIASKNFTNETAINIYKKPSKYVSPQFAYKGENSLVEHSYVMFWKYDKKNNEKIASHKKNGFMETVGIAVVGEGGKINSSITPFYGLHTGIDEVGYSTLGMSVPKDKLKEKMDEIKKAGRLLGIPQARILFNSKTQETIITPSKAVLNNSTAFYTAMPESEKGKFTSLNSHRIACSNFSGKYNQKVVSECIDPAKESEGWEDVSGGGYNLPLQGFEENAEYCFMLCPPDMGFCQLKSPEELIKSGVAIKTKVMPGEKIELFCPLRQWTHRINQKTQILEKIFTSLSRYTSQHQNTITTMAAMQGMTQAIYKYPYDGKGNELFDDLKDIEEDFAASVNDMNGTGLLGITANSRSKFYRNQRQQRGIISEIEKTDALNKEEYKKVFGLDRKLFLFQYYSSRIEDIRTRVEDFETELSDSRSNYQDEVNYLAKLNKNKFDKDSQITESQIERQSNRVSTFYEYLRTAKKNLEEARKELDHSELMLREDRDKKHTINSLKSEKSTLIRQMSENIEQGLFPKGSDQATLMDAFDGCNKTLQEEIAALANKKIGRPFGWYGAMFDEDKSYIDAIKAIATELMELVKSDLFVEEYKKFIKRYDEKLDKTSANTSTTRVFPTPSEYMIHDCYSEYIFTVLQSAHGLFAQVWTENDESDEAIAYHDMMFKGYVTLCKLVNKKDKQSKGAEDNGEGAEGENEYWTDLVSTIKDEITKLQMLYENTSDEKKQKVFLKKIEMLQSVTSGSEAVLKNISGDENDVLHLTWVHYIDEVKDWQKIKSFLSNTIVECPGMPCLLQTYPTLFKPIFQKLWAMAGAKDGFLKILVQCLNPVAIGIGVNQFGKGSKGVGVDLKNFGKSLWETASGRGSVAISKNMLSDGWQRAEANFIEAAEKASESASSPIVTRARMGGVVLLRGAFAGLNVYSIYTNVQDIVLEPDKDMFDRIVVAAQSLADTVHTGITLARVASNAIGLFSKSGSLTAGKFRIVMGTIGGFAGLANIAAGVSAMCAGVLMASEAISYYSSGKYYESALVGIGAAALIVGGASATILGAGGVASFLSGGTIALATGLAATLNVIGAVALVIFLIVALLLWLYQNNKKDAKVVFEEYYDALLKDLNGVIENLKKGTGDQSGSMDRLNSITGYVNTIKLKWNELDFTDKLSWHAVIPLNAQAGIPAKDLKRMCETKYKDCVDDLIKFFKQVSHPKNANKVIGYKTCSQIAAELLNGVYIFAENKTIYCDVDYAGEREHEYTCSRYPDIDDKGMFVDNFTGSLPTSVSWFLDSEVFKIPQQGAGKGIKEIAERTKAYLDMILDRSFFYKMENDKEQAISLIQSTAIDGYVYPSFATIPDAGWAQELGLPLEILSGYDNPFGYTYGERKYKQGQHIVSHVTGSVRDID